MVRIVPWVIILGLMLYTLFDVLATERHRFTSLSKTLWMLVAIIPVIGGLLWLTVGRPRGSARGGAGGSRSRRRRQVAPDDDPAFLRRLDEQAWRARRENTRGADAGAEAPSGADASAEAASGETSGVEASGVEASGVEASGVEESGVEMPGTETPGTDASGAEGSELSTGAKHPDAQAEAVPTAEPEPGQEAAESGDGAEDEPKPPAGEPRADN